MLINRAGEYCSPHFVYSTQKEMGEIRIPPISIHINMKNLVCSYFT